MSGMREDLAPLYDVARAGLRRRLSAFLPQESAEREGAEGHQHEAEEDVSEEERERLLAELGE